MTDKIVAWNTELTGYYDGDGEWVEPDKVEDLVQQALNRKLPEEDKNMTTNMEDTSKPLTGEVEVVDWVLDIYSIKEKVDLIFQALQKEEDKIVELEPDCLDTYAYKAKVLANNEIEMVKIGKIDSFGKLELFPIETYPPIVPSFYQPEFYYLGMKNSNLDYPSARNITTPKYKKFVPKNAINQIVISKEDIKYSTGYINSEGVAIYYDQLPLDYEKLSYEKKRQLLDEFDKKMKGE